MDFLQPTTWAEALSAKAERPDAVAIAGGTDLMVEFNYGDRQGSGALLDLTAIPELAEWTSEDGYVRLGAGVTYARIIGELGGELPALAEASRTVGSPQLRNRATVAGNLGTASPAGDAHPPLLATGAVIEAASTRGTREIDINEFFVAVKRNALQPDELIRAVRIPIARGPQHFAKVGSRNAMVIAVCTVAVTLDPENRRVGTGLGSAAPTPRRATQAESYAAATLPWHDPAPLAPAVGREFGALLAAAASPIDDVRGTAAYRSHALAVLARRTLDWAWTEHLDGAFAEGGRG